MRPALKPFPLPYFFSHLRIRGRQLSDAGRPSQSLMFVHTIPEMQQAKKRWGAVSVHMWQRGHDESGMSPRMLHRVRRRLSAAIQKTKEIFGSIYLCHIIVLQNLGVRLWRRRS
ncbi:hypothetical protein Dimus_038761 [Dionaea muscipula]